MRELVRSNDPVRLSWLTALLAEQGITAIVLDAHTAASIGGIGAVRRRLAVSDEEWARARRILVEAGELPAGGDAR